MSMFSVKRIVNGALLVAAGAAASGCITYPEQDDFGESVRNMKTVQLAGPDVRPAPQDGERARAVLRVHREDITSPQEIRNEIVINVGQ